MLTFRVVLSFLLTCVATFQAAPQATFPPTRPPSNDIKLENLVAIPMQDGTILLRGYLSSRRRGQVSGAGFPHSIQHGAYPNAYVAPVFFARRGYVFVYQDVRGRH